jgi:PAS domain S-box-containing protein
MFDRDIRYVQVSRRWLNDYGLGERDLRGLSHYDVFPEIPDSWKEAHRRGLAGEVVRAEADRFDRADGSVQWLRWEVRPWLDAEGEVGGIVIFTEDITERKRTEEALRYNELLLQEMGRVAKIGGWEFDPATGKGTWTEEVARIHDLNPDDETSLERGMSFYQGESRLKIEKAVKEAIELGKPYDLDLELVTANGTHKWVHIIGHPTVENGKVVQVRGSFQDITEHKKLETQYLHAQKMESIGTLAGGVAHDFNNVLTVIAGLGQITLMKMTQDDPHRRNIGGILEAAERATHLTKELLLFSRKQESERRPVDLNDIIGKMEKFLHRIIGEDIILKQVPHSAPLPVLADSNHLEQVLMNLAVNARDAMPQGGEFILRTEQVVLDEEFAAAHGYGNPGAYALLIVSDTGAGMDKETLQRIFEPFFSTKEVGKGTGLGLAVVYGIIKQHDGFITVYSEPGQGSTFRIYLPLTSAAARQEAGAEQERPIAGGTETILLAEDNDLVRELVTSVLTEAGYRVIVAVDGEEAVRKFRENAGSIQLLLFDLIMPRMNGKDASDAIHKIQHRVKTIFASGYAPDIAQQKASLDDGSYLIYKPVSPRDLLKKVRSVLDGTL